MFYSIQGEGRFIGVPSVFLRLYGCNFECPGFGQVRGEPMIPRDDMPWKNLDVSKYDSIRDLPVMSVGCDSSASWAKEYMHLSSFETVDIIANKLVQSTPDQMWINPHRQDTHLVITGGEPLMWQKQLPELLQHPSMSNLKNVTFETNGTFELSDSFVHTLNCLGDNGTHITWSVSPKLSISGEDSDKAIKPQNWKQYDNIHNSKLYLKFVVSDKQDVEELQDISKHELADANYDIYVMPCGGTNEMLLNTVTDVVELALQCGFKYSPRLHVDLFGNKWGT
jgi:7-carboxy-7-deazaguanine synthase